MRRMDCPSVATSRMTRRETMGQQSMIPDRYIEDILFRGCNVTLVEVVSSKMG